MALDFDKFRKKLELLGTKVREVCDGCIIAESGSGYILYSREPEGIKKSPEFKSFEIVETMEMTLIITVNVSDMSRVHSIIPVKVYDSHCNLILDEKASDFDTLVAEELYSLIFITATSARIVYKQDGVIKNLIIFEDPEIDDYAEVNIFRINNVMAIVEIQSFFYGNVYYYVSHIEGETSVQLIHRFDESKTDNFAGDLDAIHDARIYKGIELCKNKTVLSISYESSVQCNDGNVDKSLAYDVKEVYKLFPNDNSWKLIGKIEKDVIKSKYRYE